MKFLIKTRDILGHISNKQYETDEVQCYNQLVVFARTAVAVHNTYVRPEHSTLVLRGVEIINERFTLFYKGEFSQWYKRSIKDPVTGIVFNCNEQYMMYYKALLFKDTDSAEKILKETNPYRIQQLGRAVKNFNEKKWKKFCRPIIFKGNLLKFSQHADLKKLLAFTRGTTLVEASPVDKIYGVGLDSKDERIQKRKTWRGKNYLGEAITEVRVNIFGF